MKKVYFVDTCFVINLVSNGRFHARAQEVFERLSNRSDVEIKISALAVAEFVVKDDIKFIPSKIEIQPFNTSHAILAGEFGRICSKSRKEIGERLILLNDSKLFAQAQQEGAVGFITADMKAQRAFDILNESKVVSFEFLNIAKE